MRFVNTYAYRMHVKFYQLKSRKLLYGAPKFHTFYILLTVHHVMIPGK